mgnify:CR=1 FL=1
MLRLDGVRIVVVRPVNRIAVHRDFAPSLVLWAGVGGHAIVRLLENKIDVISFFAKPNRN